MILFLLLSCSRSIYQVECWDKQGDLPVFSATCPLDNLHIDPLPEGGVKASCPGALTLHGFEVTYARCSALPAPGEP